MPVRPNRCSNNTVNVDPGAIWVATLLRRASILPVLMGVAVTTVLTKLATNPWASQIKRCFISAYRTTMPNDTHGWTVIVGKVVLPQKLIRRRKKPQQKLDFVDWFSYRSLIRSVSDTNLSELCLSRSAAAACSSVSCFIAAVICCTLRTLSVWSVDVCCV